MLTKLDGSLDPGVVGRAEAGEIFVYIQGEDEIAEFDATVSVEPIKNAGLFQLVLPAIFECFRDNCLGITMRWISRADRCNAHALGNPLSCVEIVVNKPGVR